MKHDTAHYTRLGRTLALLGCLLLGAACGWAGNANDAAGTSGEGDDMRTLTTDQAAERVQQHIKRATDALPIEPSLSPLGGRTMECEDPTDNGPRGRYQVDKSYWLNDLPKDRSGEFVNKLYQYWKNNNYRILTDDRDRDDMFISVEHNGDGFAMSVTRSDQDDLSLGASSPCVWPDGVPPSSAEH